MTQIKREHAAIAVCVVAGAFVAGSAFSPIKPSKATDCDSGWMGQVTRDVQQAVGINREPQPGEQIGTYYDVRTKRDEPMYQPGGQPQAFAPAAPAPPNSVVSTPLPPSQAPTAASIPATIAESKGLTEKQWQAGQRTAVPQPVQAPQKSVMDLTPAELDAAVAEVDRQIKNGTYPGMPKPQTSDAQGNVRL